LISSLVPSDRAQGAWKSISGRTVFISGVLRIYVAPLRVRRPPPGTHRHLHRVTVTLRGMAQWHHSSFGGDLELDNIEAS
jgi:hypothetical protein